MLKSTLPLSSANIDTKIVFWPSLADLLMSVLMIFLLIYFLQATLGIDDLEAQIVRQNQDSFMQVFNKAFTKELQTSTVTVERKLNLIKLTFSDKILFDSGEYELQPRGEEVLRRCGEIFRQTNNNNSTYTQIQVEGHTDDRPIGHSTYPRDNWELATGRAISVVKFFIDKVGIKNNNQNKSLFSANGYAEFSPVADNETEEGRAKNRRIEILIIFSIPGKDNKR